MLMQPQTVRTMRMQVMPVVPALLLVALWKTAMNG